MSRDLLGVWQGYHPNDQQATCAWQFDSISDAHVARSASWQTIDRYHAATAQLLCDGPSRYQAARTQKVVKPDGQFCMTTG